MSGTQPIGLVYPTASAFERVKAYVLMFKSMSGRGTGADEIRIMARKYGVELTDAQVREILDAQDGVEG